MEKKLYDIVWVMMTSLMLLCACQTDDSDGAETKAISFSTDIADQGQGLTRAAALEHDFTVYGYKFIGDSKSMVFPGWTVKYLGGNYDYAGFGEQTIRFWDPSATEYRFWGCCGQGWAASDDGETLTIGNRTLQADRDGRMATTVADNEPLFTSLLVRKPVTTNTVNLSFSHTFSQVGMFFYYDKMKYGVASIKIEDVTFGPVEASGKAIYNRGSVTVTYPATGGESEAVTVVGDENDKRQHLDFIMTSNLTKDAGQGVANSIQASIPEVGKAADELNRFYYPLPMGGQNPDFELKLKVTELDKDGRTLVSKTHSVMVPQTYTHWKANNTYRYFFKITDTSDVMLFDVQIGAWENDGTKHDEWDNW